MIREYRTVAYRLYLTPRGMRTNFLSIHAFFNKNPITNHLEDRIYLDSTYIIFFASYPKISTMIIHLNTNRKAFFDLRGEMAATPTNYVSSWSQARFDEILV